MEKVTIPKFTLAIGLAAITLMALLSILIYHLGHSDRTGNVLYPEVFVNGEPIEDDFIAFRMQMRKAYVFDHFNEKSHGAAYEDFWHTRIDGEVPIESLKALAIDDCVRILVQFQLGYEEALLDYRDYKGFLRDLENENGRRRKAVANNEVIFGPVEFGVDEYMTYVLKNLEIELTQKLSDTILAVSEEEVREYYEINRSSRYQRGKSVSYQMIRIPYDENRATGEVGSKERVFQDLQLVRDKALEGDDFEDLMMKYNNDGKVVEARLSVDDKHFNMDRELSQVLMTLESEEISHIFEGVGVLRIVKVLDNSDADTLPYEEVKKSVENEVKGEKYNGYLEKRILDAGVIIGQPDNNKN